MATVTGHQEEWMNKIASHKDFMIAGKRRGERNLD